MVNLLLSRYFRSQVVGVSGRTVVHRDERLSALASARDMIKIHIRQNSICHSSACRPIIILALLNIVLVIAQMLLEQLMDGLLVHSLGFRICKVRVN